MIGCGEIADLHIKGVLARKDCALYAVCDTATDDRLQRRKERYGAKIAVTDYRELVNDPNVDVVIVATPDNTIWRSPAPSFAPVRTCCWKSPCPCGKKNAPLCGRWKRKPADV